MDTHLRAADEGGSVHESSGEAAAEPYAVQSEERLADELCGVTMTAAAVGSRDEVGEDGLRFSGALVAAAAASREACVTEARVAELPRGEYSRAAVGLSEERGDV